MGSGARRSNGSTTSGDLRSEAAPSGGPDAASTAITARRAFDALAKLASDALDVPAALVSVTGTDRPELAGAHGLTGPWANPELVTWSDSVCRHMAVAAPLAISDMRSDPRTSSDAAVRASHVRAFAGVSLDAGGRRRGSFGVLDRFPRDWTPKELSLLEGFATLVVALLEAASEREGRREEEEQAVLRLKTDALDRFADGIVHDFNNLLTGMRLQISLLANSGIARADLGALAECVDEGTRLTSHLMSITRRRPVEKRLVHLDEALRGSAPVLQRLAGLRSHLVLQPGAPGALVPIDLGELEHMVMHLVANGGDAMHGSGTLSVRTSRVTVAAENPAQVLPPPPGQYVRLDVEDTGQGIPPEIRRQIFEPYFTTKPGGPSKGLGLATVFAIVRSSGGGLDVQSKPGHTTFSIYFPEETTAQEVRATPAGATGEPVPGYPAVLLVDDDTTVRTLLERQLRQQNVPVVTASNAAEATIVARQHPVPLRVLLADVNLPLVSGVVLAEQLVAQLPTLRVVLISGNAQHVDTGSLPPENVAGILQKPFGLADLLPLLQPRRVSGAGQSGGV